MSIVYSIKIVSLIIDKLVYVTMLGLGIYFIYQGEVVQRFHLMRTNFMVYEEPIYEHPTIITYISPSIKNVTFGKDFKIYYTPGDEYKKEELTYGLNKISGSALEMNFKLSYEGLSNKKHFPNLSCSCSTLLTTVCRSCCLLTGEPSGPNRLGIESSLSLGEAVV